MIGKSYLYIYRNIVHLKNREKCIWHADFSGYIHLL